MKRTIIIAVAVILLSLAGIFAYRGYKANEQREQEARLAAREAERVEQRRVEAVRKAEAEAEARRLAELQAVKEAEELAAKVAEERRVQAQVEVARIAAEKAAAAATAAQEAARVAKVRADEEARKVAEIREREAREAEEIRVATIKKLEDEARAVEQERILMAEREAARQEALRRQAELDYLANARELVTRMVKPQDYKRRHHYYLDVEMQNILEPGQYVVPKDSTTKP